LDLLQGKTHPLAHNFEQKILKSPSQYPALPNNQIAHLAGYKCSNNRGFCSVFAQVMVKLDSARHHKELFRQLGWGEVRIALRFMELAQQNLNLTVALGATVQSARCLEMQKSDILGDEGFSISVTRAPTQAEKAETGPNRKGAASGKKEQITR
jgi:hypothetical protein